MSWCVLVAAAEASAQAELRPSIEFESAYASESTVNETGVNEGGLTLDLGVGYYTDYVYRGIDNGEFGFGAEDASNLQIDVKLAADLGKAPHPYISSFSNVFSDDPISRFQEVRPEIGFEWAIRPIIVTLAHTSYLYPNRQELETSEILTILELDDSYYTRSGKPMFRPYVLGAYDYDLYDGWYIEAGIRHDISLSDTGLSAVLQADVAYVSGTDLFALEPGGNNTGFQHYDLGLIALYDLNHALGTSDRWGRWWVEGQVWYTDGIDSDLKSTTQLWGGGGIRLRY